MYLLRNICLILLFFSYSCNKKEGELVIFVSSFNDKIKLNDETNFNLNIVNNFSSDVRIDNISTSCSCILFKNFKPTAIKSNDTLSVEIILKGFNLGKNSESIIITHNSKDRFSIKNIDYEVYP
jgi:hypothetical protein